MEIKIIKEFLGTINGVEFTSYKLFKSMEYILDLIQSRFQTSDDVDVFTAEFIEDLSSAVEDAYLSAELSYEDIEDEIELCIDEAESFETIHFTVYCLESRFDHVNYTLKAYPSKYVVSQ